jgi:hypothetical protein
VRALARRARQNTYFISIHLVNSFSDPNRSVLGKKGAVNCFQFSLTCFTHFLATAGQGGCYLLKTTQTVIIATFHSPISAPDCVCEVEKIGDYLISMQL